MLLGLYGDAELHRTDKMLLVRFLKPHRVISTCRVFGGLHDDLGGMFNHQSCEPAGHMRKELKTIVSQPEVYLHTLCDLYGMPERTASLGTAANMHYAAVETVSFRDLSVTAICTGGVEGNAGRVGDPASVWEGEEGFEPLHPEGSEPCGTINIMLLVNRELTPGAMVRSIVTATEAKSAVLQELAVSSRYSPGLSTGTGTDQIAVACSLTGSGRPLTSAGKHSKLGELVGQAVLRAVRKTLALQNSLTPQNQRSIYEHIRRFGVDRKEMTDAIAEKLPEETAALFRQNVFGLDRDPMAVGAVCALVHLRDKLEWGILPDSCSRELLVMQGALLALAASKKDCGYDGFIARLAGERVGLEPKDFVSFICTCCALGYREKWND